MLHAHILTPLGPIEINATEKGIRSILFQSVPLEREDVPASLENCAQQLKEYFAGTRHTFSLALDLEGTPFQERVWQELLKIPFGTTMSYLELSNRLGDPNLVRAVGSANGKNPVGIVVPCHRVIGAGGKLVGYAGGLDRKRWLLKHERALTQKEDQLF
jgi:methylated-DNA-[protein]-cysteine S-methyltransferase